MVLTDDEIKEAVGFTTDQMVAYRKIESAVIERLNPHVAELEAVLRECREALLHCEGVFDEVRGYPITYDLTIETIAKIDEVLHVKE